MNHYEQATKHVLEAAQAQLNDAQGDFDKMCAEFIRITHNISAVISSINGMVKLALGEQEGGTSE